MAINSDQTQISNNWFQSSLIPLSIDFSTVHHGLLLTKHYCQTPTGATDTEHTCQASCFSRYPLQTDSSICRIVVLLVAGLAFADKSYFYKVQCNEKSPTASELSVFQHLSDSLVC